jgi:hypothetical protein
VYYRVAFSGIASSGEGTGIGGQGPKGTDHAYASAYEVPNPASCNHKKYMGNEGLNRDLWKDHKRTFPHNSAAVVDSKSTKLAATIRVKGSGNNSSFCFSVSLLVCLIPSPLLGLFRTEQMK